MSLPPATLQQAVEDGILAALGPEAVPPVAEPWRASLTVWDVFPASDSADIESLAFAVGLPSSELLHDRQRQASGPANTTVSVRFTSLIRSDAQRADYRRAMTREVALVATVKAILPCRLADITRRVQIDGRRSVAVIDLRFVVFHPYPLS